MIHYFTWHQWAEAYLRENDKWGKFSLSPGGVMNLVGVSRQAVHRAMEAGRLDAVYIGEGQRKAILCDSEGANAWALIMSDPEAKMAYMRRAHQKSVETRWGRRR